MCETDRPSLVKWYTFCVGDPDIVVHNSEVGVLESGAGPVERESVYSSQARCSFTTIHHDHPWGVYYLGRPHYGFSKRASRQTTVIDIL